MLLPYTWQWAGIILVLAGIILAVLYLFSEFSLTMPVFAVFSLFSETKVFATFRTNFADELTLLLLVAGFSLLVFSEEKHETEILDKIRLSSMLKSNLATTVFLLFSVLFVFRKGFIANQL